MLWNRIGKDGADDQNNSEAIDVQWLVTSGNYAKYHSNNNNSIKKKQSADEICKQLAFKGVQKERSAKDVINKIASIADQFKTANDFALSDMAQD